MKNEMLSLRPTDSVEALIAKIIGSARDLQEQGEMLYRLYSNDRTVIDQIRDAAPEVPGEHLTRLLRVGERSLRPELMLNGCVAYRRLARLPYATQGEALKGKAVDLVTDTETGDTLRVPLTELTPAQVKQVFDPSGIRSKDSQAAWLRRERAAREVSNVTKQVVGAAYQVKRGEVIVLRSCVLTKADLLRLIGEIT